MALLPRKKYWYLIKAQRQTKTLAILSTRTLIWLVTMNILILAFVSFYHLWTTYRIIEQEGKLNTESAAILLEAEILDLQLTSDLVLDLSREAQITQLDSTLGSRIEDLRVSSHDLGLGYYDIALATHFVGNQNQASSPSFAKGSEEWNNYQAGRATGYKVASSAAWSKEKYVYIYPVKQNGLISGYVWATWESPSFKFLTGRAFISTIMITILATMLLFLTWHLFIRKVHRALIKTAEQIVKDPTHAHKEFRNPIFMPFKSYLESLHTKWLQAEQEYQSIERIHWMSEISAAVSHEIRNPLTTVRGFLQLFQVKHYLTDEDREILQLMISELDNSTLLIKDFLDVTKPSTKDIDNFNLGEILIRLIRVIEALALGHNVQIDLKLPEASTYLSGNLQAFRQAMINLLQNSIQAMPGGGNIWITVLKLDDQISIRIQDNGIGMDQDTLQNFGKPFFTTKKDGTGLGLPMCLHIIEQMQGKFEVSSTVGAGTTVTLTIPIAQCLPNHEAQSSLAPQLS